MYRQQNSYLIPHYQVRLIPEIHQYILPIHATLLKKELLELDFSQGVPNTLNLNYPYFRALNITVTASALVALLRGLKVLSG